MDFISYSTTRLISARCCDYRDRLTVGGILDYVSDVSTEHLVKLGFEDAFYAWTHTAFLLAKLSMRVFREIHAKSEIRIDTYPGPLMHAIWPRRTELYLEGGELAAQVDAHWTLVNTQTKRILRTAPPELAVHLDSLSDRFAHEFLSLKMTDPAFLGEEAASYSRCDNNRHMNHARYADLIMDYLPAGKLEQSLPVQVCISYHRELPLGEKMQLFVEESGEKTLFCGMRNGKNCFEAAVVF